MKISAIKTYPINVGQGSQLVVKVETESGIYGYGASGLSTRELAVIGAIEHFKSFLIGRDARQIEALWQEMYRSQYFEGGRVLTAAISAIDIALYDILAKSLHVPVYQLLGGKVRDHVECFASLRFSNLEELIAKSKALVAQGWKVIRLFPAVYELSKTKALFEPRVSVALLAEYMVKLRAEIGSEIVIGLDYHHRLTIPETVSFVKKMPPGTLDFLEEPIRDESPSAYEALRKMVDIPFAIGEEMSSKWQIMAYIERNITQFVRVDVCNIGGLTEAKKVAAMAETHYIDIMPHNPLGPICTAASIHLAAACSNVCWLEEINTTIEPAGTNDPSFYPEQPVLDGTKYKISDKPGLGVDFNEAKAKEQTFKPIEVPKLHRTDGSFTNW